MSQEIVNDLIELIGLLSECDETFEDVVVVNRDGIIEALRGVIQDEWMRTGILGAVE